MEKKHRIVQAQVLLLLSNIRIVLSFIKMFFIGRESTVTGFCFLNLNK